MNVRDKKPWYTYIIRCENSSLYTGITNNIDRRYKEHVEGKGAKYTRMNKPIEICAIFQTEDRSSASKLECIIKKLTKKSKEKLIFSKKNKKIFIERINQELNLKFFLKK